MVIYEGQPIYYYHPYGTSPSRDLVPFYQSDSSSSFSVQSDSDCSEIPQRPVRNQTVIRHTSPNKFQCRWKTCGTVFESLDQLADHVSKAHASSGLGGLFYCEWEGCSRNCKGFNARYKMLVHVRTHTNEKPHVCSQCHKSFSRAENLKIHSRSHSGEKPYVCPVAGCNKAYSNSSDRFKHTRTHQVEKPYKCKVAGCNKRYTDPSSLRKHVKTYRHSEEIGPNAISGIRERNESISSTCSSSSSNDDEINEDYHSIGRRVLHSECSSISGCSSDSDFEPLDLRVIKSRVENLSMW